MQRRKSIDNDETPLARLNSRRIILADGRYMVFYTFDLEAKTSGSETEPNKEPAAEVKDV